MGEAGPFRVKLHSVPAMICPENHRWFVFPAFGAMLMDYFMDDNNLRTLKAGKKKGLLRKHFYCGGCGQELQMENSRRKSFEFQVNLKDYSVKVELDAPVYTCGSCKLEQLASLDELHQNALKMIASAFKSADIHPQ